MSARTRLWWIALAAAGLTTGCASQPVRLPANVSVGAAPGALASPAIRIGSAPPEVLAASFSSLDVRRGQVWSGRFVTGTNVASLEVRTNLFSIDVPRTSYGRFAFSLDLLDTPPIFVRKYTLRIIARNSAGIESEEDAPFEIR